jgi:predicted Zn-dependent peptidase
VQFKTATLDNGLEIVAECNPAAYSTALGFFVKTGARDETDDVSGVSHFLEHMVFKGTPSRSAEDVNREFDDMGADYNAYTSVEVTAYHAIVLPEFQTATVELLADILRPSLREEDFTTEKQVILEEIKMYCDQPPFAVDDKCRAAFFGNHPLARSILGTESSVGGLRVDQMQQYFSRRYAPGNIVLVGSGQIDFDQLCQTAQKQCGNWQKIPAGREVPPVKTNTGFHLLQKDTAVQEYALMMSSAPSATAPERYAAKLLESVLGDDSGSRLYWELVDPGLAEHCSLHYDGYLGAGMFLTYLSCDPEYAAENLERIRQVYRQAADDGITQAELDQAKSKTSSQVVLASERPASRLFSVGLNWVQRHEYRSVRQVLDSYDAVTLADLATVQKNFSLTQSTTYVVGPLAEMAAPN